MDCGSKSDKNIPCVNSNEDISHYFLDVQCKPSKKFLSVANPETEKRWSKNVKFLQLPSVVVNLKKESALWKFYFFRPSVKIPCMINTHSFYFVSTFCQNACELWRVWSSHLDEVLMLHSGSARRQPQVSASGKKSQCVCNIEKRNDTSVL